MKQLISLLLLSALPTTWVYASELSGVSCFDPMTLSQSANLSALPEYCWAKSAQAQLESLLAELTHQAQIRVEQDFSEFGKECASIGGEASLKIDSSSSADYKLDSNASNCLLSATAQINAICMCTRP
jgi:uncharacterized protein YfcZ (UPF0381/DUF406 family)